MISAKQAQMLHLAIMSYDMFVQASKSSLLIKNRSIEILAHRASSLAEQIASNNNLVKVAPKSYICGLKFFFQVFLSFKKIH